MNKTTIGIACILLMIVLSGCSRKKDKFINRSWHAVTSEYNTLYNGNLALEQGKEQIAQTYLDNFWQLLPVEKMQISEEIRLPGAETNEFFKIAEEKAAKAIQRHSMLIEGQEKNPQIDEAYLLLGKARYYDQRFIPALEAFNYILHKYPASNTINHAQIWREKTNMRLENDRLAIKNLKKLIAGGKMDKVDLADARAILAQAYINTGSLDSALVSMRIAASNAPDNDKKGRYHYIEGQLYNYLQKRDSANLAFDKVIDLNRRIPREYLVNARLEKVRNFNFDENDPHLVKAKLIEMAEDRENRPFLDKINFQLAEYYRFLDSTSLAIEYYNKSLRTPSGDNFLQSVNYETLGNIYFHNTDYRMAGAYYDSTLTKIPNTTRDYFVIERKRENLNEVIMYEEIVEENDSILRLVEMTEPERIEFFTAYTDGLKAQAVEQARMGAITEAASEMPGARPAMGPPALGSAGPPPALGGPSSNTFYFYNPARVATGMREFLAIWGPRELQDNWRTESGNITRGVNEGLDEVSELIIANNPQFNPQTYLEKIPTDNRIIDSLQAQRNNSYYKLGLIYKEKFRENALAAEKLEALLNFTSEERLVLPASYYLYQIYTENGNSSEAEKHKDYVLLNHPNSRYASGIKNPGGAIEMEDTAENSYKTLYTLFENGQFEQVIKQGQIFAEQYGENEMLPKIELLSATATGRLYGFEAYKKLLQEIALNYPQTEEGKKAQQLLSTTLPSLQNSEFTLGENQKNAKLLYRIPASDTALASQMKQKIDEAIEALGYENYSTSIDVYNIDTTFVAVHGIESPDRAGGFAELLQVNDTYKIETKPIIVSSENYRIIQLHKNLQAYLEQQNNPISQN